MRWKLSIQQIIKQNRRLTLYVVPTLLTLHWSFYVGSHERLNVQILSSHGQRIFGSRTKCPQTSSRSPLNFPASPCIFPAFPGDLMWPVPKTGLRNNVSGMSSVFVASDYRYPDRSDSSWCTTAKSHPIEYHWPPLYGDIFLWRILHVLCANILLHKCMPGGVHHCSFIPNMCWTAPWYWTSPWW